MSVTRPTLNVFPEEAFVVVVAACFPPPPPQPAASTQATRRGARRTRDLFITTFRLRFATMGRKLADNSNRRHPTPSQVTLAVVLQVRGRKLHVLLWQRAQAPFRGSWSLPGGRLESGETLEESIRRQLEAKVDVHELALPFPAQAPRDHGSIRGAPSAGTRPRRGFVERVMDLKTGLRRRVGARWRARHARSAPGFEVRRTDRSPISRRCFATTGRVHTERLTSSSTTAPRPRTSRRNPSSRRCAISTASIVAARSVPGCTRSSSTAPSTGRVHGRCGGRWATR